MRHVNHRMHLGACWLAGLNLCTFIHSERYHIYVTCVCKSSRGVYHTYIRSKQTSNRATQGVFQFSPASRRGVIVRHHLLNSQRGDIYIVVHVFGANLVDVEGSFGGTKVRSSDTGKIPWNVVFWLLCTIVNRMT